MHCRASSGKSTVYILFPIEPEHGINLRGVPSELVPGYFVNSLLVLTTYVIREGSGEHVRLRNFARVSGGFRGGALGASAPPAESMVKIS